MDSRFMTIGEQLAFLFILAIPVASIAWTVTHEEVFREPREWCKENSQACRRLYQRKFFYLFTCEYCFSHYVVALFLYLTRFKMLFPDWRGYLVSGCARGGGAGGGGGGGAGGRRGGGRGRGE